MPTRSHRQESLGFGAIYQAMSTHTLEFDAARSVSEWLDLSQSAEGETIHQESTDCPHVGCSPEAAGQPPGTARSQLRSAAPRQYLSPLHAFSVMAWVLGPLSSTL